MKKNHLADLELDIHELAYLLETLAVTPDHKLKNIAKRNILRIREQLDSLYEELDADEENTPDEEPEVIPVVAVEEEKELDDSSSVEEEAAKVVLSISIDGEEESDDEKEEPEEKAYIDNPEALPEEEQEEIELPVNGLKGNIKAHWQQKYFTEEKKNNIPLKQIISLSDSFYFSRILFDGETGKLLRLLEELEETGTADEALENYSGYFPGLQNEEDQEAYIDLGARIYGWFRDKEK